MADEEPVQLDVNGLLPVGIHDLSLTRVGDLFARFQRSDRRIKLYERLCAYVSEIRKLKPSVTILLDGSFVMSKVDEPGDIDVLLLLPAAWDVAADLRPYEYNLVSKRVTKKLYGFDVLLAQEGSDAANVAIRFFSQVNVKWPPLLKIPVGLSKGLVRIVP